MSRIQKPSLILLLFVFFMIGSSESEGSGPAVPDFNSSSPTVVHDEMIFPSDVFPSEEGCPNFSGTYEFISQEESVKFGSGQPTDADPLAYLFGAVRDGGYLYRGKIHPNSKIKVEQIGCGQLRFGIPFEDGDRTLELDMNTAYHPFECDSTSCTSFNSSWRTKIGGMSRDSSQKTIGQDKDKNLLISFTSKEAWFGVPAPLPLMWYTHAYTMTLKRVDESAGAQTSFTE